MAAAIAHLTALSPNGCSYCDAKPDKTLLTSTSICTCTYRKHSWSSEHFKVLDMACSALYDDEQCPNSEAQWLPACDTNHVCVGSNALCQRKRDDTNVAWRCCVRLAQCVVVCWRRPNVTGFLRHENHAMRVLPLLGMSPARARTPRRHAHCRAMRTSAHSIQR